MPRSKILPANLPQQRGEAWQGGWFVAPVWIEGPDGPSKPWIPIWFSLSERFLTAGKFSAERGPDEDTLPLLDEMFEDLGRRPSRIEVSEPGLQKLISERLAGAEIDVVLRNRLKGVQDVLRSLGSKLGSPQLPGALEVRGVTVESMRRFAEAARAFYESAPWRHLSERDLIEIRANAPPGFRYASVLGMGHATEGLGFFDDEQAFWEVASGGGDPSGNGSWMLSFVSIAHLPLADAELWVEHGLPVAGREAYPVALRVQSASRIKRPSPRVLDFLTGLLRALAESGPEEFDRGRWERRVDAIQGPRTYELRLPFLLDPPSQQELIRRRILPDPRSFERLHFLFHKKLADVPVNDKEELEELLDRELGSKPIDAIPYEPKDDRERAQEICFHAFDAWGRAQMQLVERALALDPDCIDALVLKAERVYDPDEEERLYERAAAVGEKSLETLEIGEFAESLWTYYPTRPYLRALHGLAHARERRGREDEAIAGLERLLELDPEDHQAIRYCLLSALLESGRFRDAERHIKEYASEDESLWSYARALAAFGRHGDRKRARKLLAEALERNPIAAALLLELEVLQSEPELDVDGDQCATELRNAWSATPGALDWLSQAFEDAELAG